MIERQELRPNKTDFIASIAKSTLGIVPIGGPFLSELIGNVIPNQRLDRLIKYVQELESRVSKIGTDVLQKVMSNDEFIDLIEESFVQASRALSDERRSYIASIVTTGLTNESIQHSESKYLMKILEELNDIEVIWLKYYQKIIEGEDWEFTEKHANVLTPISSYLDSDKETINRSSLQDSYKEHLERLQLIRGHINIDRKTGMPTFDSKGKPVVSYTLITSLGELLIEQIGL